MSFMDKVKSQAGVAVQKAQEAGRAGQAKLDEVQARRHADGLLRELGEAVYLQRRDGESEARAADVERLVTALQEHEAQHGRIGGGQVVDA